MTADKISVELTTIENQEDIKIDDDSLEENAYRELLKERLELEDTPKDSLEMDVEAKHKTESIIPDTFDHDNKQEIVEEACVVDNKSRNIALENVSKPDKYEDWQPFPVISRLRKLESSNILKMLSKHLMKLLIFLIMR